jgi:hypothetical protein
LLLCVFFWEKHDEKYIEYSDDMILSFGKTQELIDRLSDQSVQASALVLGMGRAETKRQNPHCNARNGGTSIRVIVFACGN